MRRKSPDLLTQADWKIMKIVWELGKGTSREISEIALKRHEWAPTTVKTMLSNLVAKGLLQTAEDGNRFIYSPTKPAIKTLTKAADELMDRSVDTVKGQLLCYMTQKVNLTQKDLDELQNIIDEHRKREKRAP
ncbi:MAG: BlaI/MecI/CopY family transcriptional regulator [Phycisphaerales bacterium]|jgi:predicted transcriptional regulator